MSFDAAKKLIDNAELVSFDIFDTLITRQVYKPTDIFYFVQQAINQSADDIYLQFDFPAERIKTEQIVRNDCYNKGLNPDVATLDDIYEVLAERNLLSNKTANKIKKWELKIEQDTMVAYPPGIELFNYAVQQQKRIILLSDMYLPLKAVEAMVSRSGYSGYGQLILSNHDGICKSDGSAFAHILATFEAPASRWLHVGDNVDSDVAAAQSFGITTFLVPKKETVLQSPWRCVDFYEFNEVGVTERTGSLTAISALTQLANQNKSGDFWWRLGNEVGGHLQVGFTDWLLNAAAEQQVDKLIFLARDGQIAEKVFSLAEKRHAGAKIDHDYCFASRRLFNIAAIDQLTSKDVDFILSGTTPLTAGQYLERINLLTKQSRQVLKRHSIQAMQTITPELRNSMRAAIWTLAPQIQQQAHEERQRLKKYLLSLGVKDKKIGIVDIGWHGSMQRALDKILKIENLNCQVVGFYFGLHDIGQPTPENMFAYINERTEPAVYPVAVRGSVEIVELLFSADHPTIIGLESNGKPIYGSQTVTGYDATALQAGIMAFAEAFFATNLPIAVTVDTAVQSIARLTIEPTPQEVALIGQVTHYEGFGYNTNLKGRPVIVAPRWYHLLAGRSRWQQIRRNSFWPAGFARQVETMLMFRLRRKIITKGRGIYHRGRSAARKVIPRQ